MDKNNWLRFTSRENIWKYIAKDLKTIEAEAFHHFKYCPFCIPSALDVQEDKRLCPEGLSYLHRIRQAIKEKKND